MHAPDAAVRRASYTPCAHRLRLRQILRQELRNDTSYFRHGPAPTARTLRSVEAATDTSHEGLLQDCFWRVPLSWKYGSEIRVLGSSHLTENAGCTQAVLSVRLDTEWRRCHSAAGVDRYQSCDSSPWALLKMRARNGAWSEKQPVELQWRIDSNKNDRHARQQQKRKCGTPTNHRASSDFWTQGPRLGRFTRTYG